MHDNFTRSPAPTKRSVPLGSLSIFDLVGATPMAPLQLFRQDFPKAHVTVKLEYLNPGGSLKDRPVSRILLKALENGELTDDKIILDSSSGNAGIAYALFGAVLGKKVELVIPGNASAERLGRIRAHGAEVILTDPLEGYDDAIREARLRYQENPDKYFFADQYGNENNWLAHYHSTAEEILIQEPGLTHFVGGVGTGGSLTGISRKLNERKPEVTIVCVRPERFPGVEGLKPLGDSDDIIPAIFDETLIDRFVDVRAEQARQYAHALAREGFFAGTSSGAYLAAVRQILEGESEARVVTLLNDSGERYFSAGLWD